MKNFTIQILIYLLAFCTQTLAQNNDKDLSEVTRFFRASEKMTVDVDYNLYENYSSTKVVENLTGKTIKQGSEFMTDLMDITAVYLKKQTIIIDKEDKKIIISDPLPDSYKKMTLVNIDSLLSSQTRMEVKALPGNLKLYSFKMKEKSPLEFTRIDILIDKGEKLIKKMVLYYKYDTKLDEDDKTAEKPRLELIYTSKPEVPSGSSEWFDEGNYYSKHGGKYVPSAKYKDYEVVYLKTR